MSAPEPGYAQCCTLFTGLKCPHPHPPSPHTNLGNINGVLDQSANAALTEQVWTSKRGDCWGLSWPYDFSCFWRSAVIWIYSCVYFILHVLDIQSSRLISNCVIRHYICELFALASSIITYFKSVLKYATFFVICKAGVIVCVWFLVVWRDLF